MLVRYVTINLWSWDWDGLEWYGSVLCMIRGGAGLGCEGLGWAGTGYDGLGYYGSHPVNGNGEALVPDVPVISC